MIMIMLIISSVSVAMSWILISTKFLEDASSNEFSNEHLNPIVQFIWQLIGEKGACARFQTNILYTERLVHVYTERWTDRETNNAKSILLVTLIIYTYIYTS